MNRIQQGLILAAAIAIPVAAYGLYAPAADSACFHSGGAAYRIAGNPAAADLRVKIAGDVKRPDLRMQLVDRAETADFVLVDGTGAGDDEPCPLAQPIHTVALAADKPDVTVSLSADSGASDYKIYVRSERFSQQDAVALLAAIWKANQRGEVTGSIR